MVFTLATGREKIVTRKVVLIAWGTYSCVVFYDEVFKPAGIKARATTINAEKLDSKCQKNQSQVRFNWNTNGKLFFSLVVMFCRQ